MDKENEKVLNTDAASEEEIIAADSCMSSPLKQKSLIEKMTAEMQSGIRAEHLKYAVPEEEMRQQELQEALERQQASMKRKAQIEMRREAMRKRRLRRRYFLVGIFAAILVIVLLLLLPQRMDTALLGRWENAALPESSDGGVYVFSENGKGVFEFQKMFSYPFAYETHGTTLKISFENPTLENAQYEYRILENHLTLKSLQGASEGISYDYEKAE